MLTTKEAWARLETAVKEDPEYAWALHCNIAAPLMDTGVPHLRANRAAANVVKHLFGVDTGADPRWAAHVAPQVPRASRGAVVA